MTTFTQHEVANAIRYMKPLKKGESMAEYKSYVLNFLGISDAVINAEEIIHKIEFIETHYPECAIVIKPARNTKGLLNVYIFRSKV